MIILLDTCAFLWWTLEHPSLTKTVRDAIANPANDVYLSALSAWEIAIKHGLGRLHLPEPPAQFVPTRRQAYCFMPLPLDEESALQVSRLPPLHADPFDRGLVSQSIVHGMTIATPDPLIISYGVRTVW